MGLVIVVHFENRNIQTDKRLIVRKVYFSLFVLNYILNCEPFYAKKLSQCGSEAVKKWDRFLLLHVGNDGVTTRDRCHKVERLLQSWL